jgi:hypothetical protein
MGPIVRHGALVKGLRLKFLANAPGLEHQHVGLRVNVLQCHADAGGARADNAEVRLHRLPIRKTVRIDNHGN